MTVTAQTETITPEKAKELLRHNPTNRRVSAQRVGVIVRALRSGDWVLNGETIKVAEGGRLLDGQHRLTAIVQSGIPAPLIVVHGLPDADSVVETIDIGKPRQFKDYLQMNGIPDAFHTAATTNLLCVWSNLGRPDTKMATKYTVHELADFYHSHEGIRLAVKRSVTVRHTYPGGASWSACWYKFNETDPDACAAFWEMLSTGAGIEDGSPILALRRYFTLTARRAIGQSIHLEPLQTCHIIVKAWNHWRRGKKIQLLAVKNDEQFPEVA